MAQAPENPEGLNFFQFLVDPASFTQTVENIFDFSFLVRKGSASLSVDEEHKLPIINTVPDSANEVTEKKSTQVRNTESGHRLSQVCVRNPSFCLRSSWS